jgi:haloalkane dehalogenase
MRDYLARHWQVNDIASPRQDLVPAEFSLFRVPYPLFKQLILVGALGCSNGCCFCATSSKFRSQKFPVLQGKELFNTLHRQATSYPRIRYVLIYEEDFLADRDKVLEFMACMDTCEELRDRPLLLTVFATTRSLARYSITELVRCGIGTVFVGVESFSPDVLQQEALSKREGNVGQLFQTLHAHGINTLGSLIVGWDSQTIENTEQDIAGFIQANPTFYQVIPLHPVPGTPLWKDLKRQNRLLDSYRYEDDRVNKYIFKLENFTAGQGLALVNSAYTGLVEEGGPWPFRVFENLLSGHCRLSASADLVLQNRARAYYKLLGQVLPLAVISRMLFSGPGFKKRWQQAMQTCRRQFPVRYWSGLLAGILYLPVLAVLYGLAQIRHFLSPAGDQPRQIRIEYNPGS